MWKVIEGYRSYRKRQTENNVIHKAGAWKVRRGSGRDKSRAGRLQMTCPSACQVTYFRYRLDLQFTPAPKGTFDDDKGKNRGTLGALVAHYQEHREGMVARLGGCLGPSAG